MYRNAAGIMTSRNDNFALRNISFFNFGHTGSVRNAAIFMCSVCNNVCERRVDPASMRVNGISFSDVT